MNSNKMQALGKAKQAGGLYACGATGSKPRCPTLRCTPAPIMRTRFILKAQALPGGQAAAQAGE